MARSVAEMLNAQPIGGKKGTRWRDDIWTMKYLPRFKWNMLTEQVGMLFDFNCYSLVHGLLFSTRSCSACCQAASGTFTIQGRATRISEECGTCTGVG